jgi:hypothetical protein
MDDVQAEIAAAAAAEAPIEEPAAEAPTLEPELPADVRAILDEEPEDVEPEPEPDDDEGPEFEPAAEWEDDESKLRKQLARLTKERDFLKNRTLKQDRARWQEEISQYFPLVAPRAKAIAEQAGSRREALRLADEQNRFAKEAAGPMLAHYEANIDKIVQERIDAEREALYAQWGRPIGGPGQAPGLAADRADQEAELAGARTLHERILTKMRQGKLAPELTVTEVAQALEE